MLRSVLFGAAGVIVLVAIVGYFVVTQGWMDVSAQAQASPLERWAARASLHAAINRGTSSMQDPLPENDQNLSAGIHLYAANCAVCHGAADEKPSMAAQGMYIKPPQLAKDGVEDDPESETYWKIAHGIRFSAMPAFERRLTDTQMWQLAQFLKHLDSLPPAVDAEWKKVPSAAAKPSS
jgi:thiosulfate dehydrogenase